MALSHFWVQCDGTKARKGYPATRALDGSPMFADSQFLVCLLASRSLSKASRSRISESSLPVVEKRVESWTELIDELFQDSWRPELERFRSNYAFRGIPDCRSRLETGLVRLGGDYAKIEGHMVRNFTKYAYAETGAKESFWHWLALAYARASGAVLCVVCGVRCVVCAV